MKVMTVLGTRPEIIRLSRIMPRLDELCDHVIVHTGQNHNPRLKDLFFEELGLRRPDYSLAMQGSLGVQLATLFKDGEQLLRREQPDRLLVLGDTNSGLIALLAKRQGIPVIHLEAGNRCYNERSPEEVNRRAIDHASDLLLPYTTGSRDNLLREGVPPRRILVVGNPIFEVIAHYEPQISRSCILSEIGLSPHGYFLVTLHRAENVDEARRCADFLTAFSLLSRRYGIPVIVSTHPRLRDHLGSSDSAVSIPAISADGVQFKPPFGFFDFLSLERQARCVLTDSGTVQEECCLARVPSVILRHETERPETLECGSGTLVGHDPESILAGVHRVLGQPVPEQIPREYIAPHLSQIVAQLALGLLPGT